jgi:Holliday junction resolvasome RuvABC endonuclease subunit
LIIIGIDFSIQFPAVCICRDFKSFNWIACVNTNTTKIFKKFLDDTEQEFKSLKFIHLPARIKGQDTYSGSERSKLANYSILIDAIVTAVIEEIGTNEKIIVSIEGIAYGAQGNALIDISQATGMLRKAVLDRVLNGQVEKVFIFSPGELKNAIGAKGNAGKFDVYQVFKNSPVLAENSDLHQVINRYEEQILKGQEVKSPFMDMIDSYLAVLKIYNSLKESE